MSSRIPLVQALVDTVGMMIRILAVNLVPVAFFLMGLLEKTPWIILQEVITIGVELIYVWALRRTLISRERQ